jgi:hypothetical protein
LWLENATLRINEGKSLSLKDKTSVQLGPSEVIVDFSKPADMVERRHTY